MTDRMRKLRLVERALEALSPLERACTLCPRNCGVDRTAGQEGICRTGARAIVSHGLLHHGEEPILSGTGGSGTIFFAGCNLKCLFCQNYQISWDLEGRPMSDDGLADLILDLQARGAHNINFVSPSHVTVPILRALRIALGSGLDLPLVWNSNGYESVQALQALDGIIDIYLPDLKYRSPEISSRYSGAADYFEKASEALREMSVQQPVLELGPGGTARKGLIIRHLVLPGQVGDSLDVLRWLRANLSPFIGLSLMSQYHPRHQAPPELRGPLTPAEYAAAAAVAQELGFERLFLQPEPFGADEHLFPDFRKKTPFRWK